MSRGLSVVIPWCDRAELGETLAKNRVLFEEQDAEVVVVNCGGDATALTGILATAPVAGLRAVDLPGASFNKSLALNLGAHAATAPRLFFLDADLILEDGFFAPALAQLDDAVFVTLDRVVESRPAPVSRAAAEATHLAELAHLFEFVDAKGRRIRLETNRVHFRDDSRGAPGMVLLKRESFLAVGGMNSDLEGWSWEDLDLLARLLFHGFERRRTGCAVHLTHGDDVRALGGRSRPQSEAANFSMCLTNYRLGHLVGTYDDDVSTWEGKWRRLAGAP